MERDRESALEVPDHSGHRRDNPDRNPDGASSPLVTVVMNCFNGEEYLREAIESILSQTYENWEIVFWDNQSTDESSKIFHSYDDPRFNYYYAPQHTLLYEARNYAIERSHGEIITFLDTDDWWLPERLERHVPLFADPEVGLSCGNWLNSSARSNKVWKGHTSDKPSGWVFHELLRGYWVGLTTLSIRKTALDELPYLCNPRFQIIGDFDLVLRLAERWKCEYLREPLSYYRVHEKSLMARGTDRYLQEMEEWLQSARAREPTASSRNLRCVEWAVTYSRAMHYVSEGRRDLALECWRDLPWRRLRMKVTIAILFPGLVDRRGRSPRAGKPRDSSGETVHLEEEV